MRHRVIYSPRTVRDLERIYVYLTTESGDPKVSNNYLVRMLDAATRSPLYRPVTESIHLRGVGE